MVNYYKKQVEIAREFGVSEGTVTNWIKGAEERKNNLQLIEVEGKQKIVKNEHNRVEMINLANNGKKYRPDEDILNLQVQSEMYEIMRDDLLISFMNNLVLMNEISYKYSFVGPGANLWSEFYNSVSDKDSYGYEEFKFLWQYALDYITVDIERYDKINIIDIGPGNFYPSKYWVDELINIGKLGYYVPVDVSPEILTIATENFCKLYDSRHLKGYDSENKSEYINNHIADLDKNSLDHIVIPYKEFSSTRSLNIFFFLGGTVGNMLSVERSLQNIKDAMSPEDYLIVDNSFDSITNRTVFPISEFEKYDDCVMFIPRMLGLTEEMFEREYLFNEKTGFREYNLVMKQSTAIHFEKFNFVKLLKKNEKLRIWKHRRSTFDDIYNVTSKAELQLQAILKHPTQSMILYITKPKFNQPDFI